MSLWPLARHWPLNGTAQVCWQCLTNHLSCTCSHWTGAFVWTLASSSMPAVCTPASEISLLHCINFTSPSVLFWLWFVLLWSGCCRRPVLKRGIWILSLTIYYFIRQHVYKSLPCLFDFSLIFLLLRGISTFIKSKCCWFYFLSWLIILKLESFHSLIYIFILQYKIFCLNITLSGIYWLCYIYVRLNHFELNAFIGLK